MIKEPNETLVMTTCKCRENTKNLVMTRAWFQEQLANKIELGRKEERERIIRMFQAFDQTATIADLLPLLTVANAHPKFDEFWQSLNEGEKE